MSKPKKYTMRDVARLANVSTSTVSAVINGTATVSENRSQRVRQAMQSLDFHPDHIARSLKTGSTKTIGVIIPDITNVFYPALVRGIEDAARVVGYSVLLCNSNEDPILEHSLLGILFSRRVDGVLLACCDNSSAYDSLIRQRFPLVFVDRIPEGVKENAVSSDNIEAGCLATKHLLELGHRRIGLLAGRLTLSPHRERLQGFRKSMGLANLPVPPQYIYEGDMQIESGYWGGKKLLSLPQPPTAVIASNNKLLLGFLSAVNESKFRCPNDLSIIGFDDYVWNEHFVPRLTIVVQPSYDMGAEAFAMLNRRMQSTKGGTGSFESTILLKTQLRIRESTTTSSPMIQAETALGITG